VIPHPAPITLFFPFLLISAASAASGRSFPDDGHTGAAGKALIVGASRQTGEIG